MREYFKINLLREQELKYSIRKPLKEIISMYPSVIIKNFQESKILYLRR